MGVAKVIVLETLVYLQFHLYQDATVLVVGLGVVLEYVDLGYHHMVEVAAHFVLQVHAGAHVLLVTPIRGVKITVGFSLPCMVIAPTKTTIEV